MEILHFASIGDVESLSALAEESDITVRHTIPMCTFHVNVAAPFSQNFSSHHWGSIVTLQHSTPWNHDMVLQGLRLVTAISCSQVSNPTCCDYDKRTPL